MAGSPFARILGAAEEVKSDTSYHFNNTTRIPSEALVVQRTLAGAAYFEDATGRHLVGVGRAMLFTHREDSRYGYPPDAREPYRLQYINFPSTPALLSLFELLRHDFGPVINLPADSRAAVLFAEVVTTYQRRRFDDVWQECERLYSLLIALYREQVQASKSRDPVEYGWHYLRSRFRQPIHLKAVAAACGVTREHFVRAFRKRYGETPGTLLRRLRLEHARELLLATTLRVEEVALSSGFASVNTFSRAFRQHYHGSPGRVRHRGRNE